LKHFFSNERRLEIERDELQAKLVSGGGLSPHGVQSVSSPHLVMTNGSLGRHSSRNRSNNYTVTTTVTQDGRRQILVGSDDFGSNQGVKL